MNQEAGLAVGYDESKTPPFVDGKGNTIRTSEPTHEVDLSPETIALEGLEGICPTPNQCVFNGCSGACK